MAERPASTWPGRLVSVSRPAPGLSARALLAQARGRPRFYWENRRRAIAFAGFGVAVDLFAWGEERFAAVERQARALFRGRVVDPHAPSPAAPRLFGGFAFRDDFVPDNTWSVFHPAHFVLPHYQFVQAGPEAWLTLNANLPPQEDVAETLPQLRDALDARYDALRAAPTSQPMPHGPPTAVADPWPYPGWAAAIENAQAAMRAGELNKVVLARVRELRFGERVDVDGALTYLDEHYPDCLRFLFEPRPYHAFFGATPELLAAVDGARVTTMSLAGSIARGATPEEDEALARALADDPKEQEEHALVVAAIRRRLAPLTTTLSAPDTPDVLRLSNIQHLHTPVAGELRSPAGVLPIVAALHPTPALGGSPRARALAAIRAAEPVPRGWYAGPVGWIDHRLDGEFGVAIRSAVSQERRVWLYAGAGIVAASMPEKEWLETGLKFRPMMDALGASVAVAATTDYDA